LILAYHASHCMDTALMTGVDEQIGVTPHKVLSHANLCPIGEQSIRVTLECLDVAENVIPSTTIEANRMVPQFIQDFIHLKHCWKCFNQDSGPNASVLNSSPFLCPVKHIIPYSSFPAKQNKNC